MTVLSDKEIYSARSDGKIVIEPYNQAQLTSCAYDVRLGNQIIRSRYEPQQSSRKSSPNWYCHHNDYVLITIVILLVYKFFTDYTFSYVEVAVAVLLGRAVTELVASFLKTNTVRSKSKAIQLDPWAPDYDYWLQPEDPVSINGRAAFVLQPGELVLAFTQEFIGTTKGSEITTMMKARSSIARIGLTICSCGGWGDVGYFNRWCMEIKNHSRVALVIPVGIRVGQIVFLATAGASQDYSKTGQYQNSAEIKEVINNWTIDGIYPSPWKDKDLAKLDQINSWSEVNRTVELEQSVKPPGFVSSADLITPKKAGFFHFEGIF